MTLDLLFSSSLVKSEQIRICHEDLNFQAKKKRKKKKKKVSIDRTNLTSLLSPLTHVRARERERDRQTDRQTDRLRVTDTDTNTEKYRDVPYSV